MAVFYLYKQEANVYVEASAIVLALLTLTVFYVIIIVKSKETLLSILAQLPQTGNCQ